MNLKFILLLNAILFSVTTYCQVDDIGVYFKKSGYLEEVDDVKKVATINFLLKDQIQRQQLFFSDAKIIAGSKDQEANRLKAGMEIMVEGDDFKGKDYSVAKTITVLPPKSKKSITGRIDAIAGDYAIIGGHKIKLSNGVKIKGVDEYKGKSFDRFTSLKLGDIATVEGTGTNSCYMASKVEVRPEVETAADKKVKESIKKLHDEFYPVWSDTAKRQTLFGMELPGVGTIASSKILQDYVNKVANSLIPEQAKRKTKFMFVVVNNEAFNAWVLPNGFSCVYTGLLAKMENEAQLAAVLGHEISHVLYEHGAKGVQDKENEAKKKNFFKTAGGFVKDGIELVNAQTNNGVTKILNSGPLAKIDAGTRNALLNDLPEALSQKKLSNYSVEQEEEADRVGLYLMVAAGYDPREAAIVWKNNFNETPARQPETKQGAGLASNIMQGAAAQGKASAASIVQSIFKNQAAIAIERMKGNSKKSHPDDIQRFESLNQMVNLYWFDNALLEKSTKGGESWEKAIAAATPELEKDAWENEYKKLGDNYEEKITYLNVAIKKGYAPVEGFYRMRGVCHYILSKNKEAIDDFNKAILLNPNDANTWYLRGLIKKGMGKSLEAIADFTKAISLNKADENFYYARACCQYNLSKYKEAVTDLDKAVELNSNVPKFFFARGDCKYKTLKYQPAIADYEMVLSLDPENADATNNIEVCQSALAKTKSGSIKLIIIQTEKIQD